MLLINSFKESITILTRALIAKNQTDSIIASKPTIVVKTT